MTHHYKTWGLESGLGSWRNRSKVFKLCWCQNSTCCSYNDLVKINVYYSIWKNRRRYSCPTSFLLSCPGTDLRWSVSLPRIVRLLKMCLISRHNYLHVMLMESVNVWGDRKVGCFTSVKHLMSTTYACNHTQKPHWLGLLSNKTVQMQLQYKVLSLTYSISLHP